MKTTNSSWERIRYEIYHSNKINELCISFWFVLALSFFISCVVYLIGDAIFYFSDEMKISVDHIPLDSAKVAKKLEDYQKDEIYKNSSYSQNLERVEWDVKWELRKELKEKMKKQYEFWGHICLIPGGIFCFSILSCVTVCGIRKYAKEKAIKAEDTKKQRTETFRKNYVAKHKDEILAKTHEIKERHEKLILNTKKKEYFDRFVSSEVYEMWDEEYKLWEMATEYYHTPEVEEEKSKEDKSKAWLKGEIKRKKDHADLMIKKLVIETFSHIKGRSVLHSEYKKFEAKILKGRAPDKLSDEERRELEDLKDMYRQSLDRLGGDY